MLHVVLTLAHPDIIPHAHPHAWRAPVSFVLAAGLVMGAVYLIGRYLRERPDRE